MKSRIAALSSALSLLASLVAMGADGTSTSEHVSEDLHFTEVRVQPDQIEFSRQHESAQMILSARLENGEWIDVTRTAELENESVLVDVSPTGRIRPLGNGKTDLQLRVGELTVRVPVLIDGQDDPFQASFRSDVMPIIAAAGCNAGGCHGSQDGENGFKLSLRGYDPDADHVALTDDLEGRRFNRAAPEQSLFLLKPTASVPHEGGQVIAPGSRDYEVLRAWVEAGAPNDSDSPRVTSIEVLPEEPSIPQPGMSQQVAVLANYSDGTRRDVTAQAFIETSDTEITEVDDTGLVTALRRGEAAVLARYEGQYAARTVFVMGDREGFAWQEVPENNFVDELVYAKLRQIKALPSGLCTDAEFLRRITLDLTGLTPTPKEVRTFLLDGRDSRKKRDEVIERLIGSAEFVQHWTNKWSDLLQVNSEFLGTEGAEALRNWTQRSIASNEPYDEFVGAILNSSGSTIANPPAAYYKVLREADEAMENTTQLFMGTRFNCNKCHDHPFERWTQGDHQRLSAFFSGIEREDAEGSMPMPRTARNQIDGDPPAFEEIISDIVESELVDAAAVPPGFPFEHAGESAAEDAPRRAQLAGWLTAAENPYFARSYVNRLWSYFLGIGLIEPVDDIRAGNPSTNPALLERLTREFIDSDFDVRHVMRLICRSRVYQHSIETNKWNEDDGVNYSHALARRLPAEVMYDALHNATGSRTHLPSVRAGTLASELVDSSVKTTDGFLDLFGRPPRESACECERKNGMSLGQALSLVNGPTVSAAIRDPENMITELLAIETDAAKIIDELYIAFLGQPPSDEQTAAIATTFEVTDSANRAALSPEDERALATELAAWEASVPIIHWSAARAISASSSRGAEFALQDDGSFLVTSEPADKDSYSIVVWSELAGITGLRLEALPDPSLPGEGPGLAESNGNFVLNELRATAIPSDDPASARPLALQNATASFSQDGWAVAGAIDGERGSGWAVSPRFGERHVAVFELSKDIGGAGGTTIAITLDHDYGSKHNLGRFRIAATNSPRPVRYHGLSEELTDAFGVASADRTEQQHALIYAHFVETHAKWPARLRLSAAQDLAWALANSPAFLFNR